MKSLIRLLVLSALVFSFASQSFSQETFPRNGVADHREGLYAFTNATIYKSWNEKLDNATLVIRKGRVEAVGQGIAVPPGAVVIDAKGKTIYPSFIELVSDYGMPKERPGGDSGGGSWFNRRSVHTAEDRGAHAWNDALKPEFDAAEVFKTDDKTAGDFRKAGFGAVLTHKRDGISRGSSALVTLSDEREHEVIVKERVGHHLSFRKGTAKVTYPTSLMGAIALLRQTYYDGKWYAEVGRKEEVNLSLEAWNDVLGLRQFFEVGDKLEVLRAARLGKEFGITYTIVGNGDEYQRLNEIKATGSPLVIPVNFPDAYDVEDPYDALSVSLAQMKHWELAPTNPARLEKAGMQFAITSEGVQRKSDFIGKVKEAIKNGLSKEQALKALTYTPAELTGSLDELGSLEKGKLANFIITNGDIFGDKTKIYHNWIKGKPFVFKDLTAPDLEGEYMLTIADMAYKLAVSEDGDNFKMAIVVDDSTKIDVKNKISDGRITLSFKPDSLSKMMRLSGTINADSWMGTGQDGNGNWVQWKATRSGDLQKDEAKPEGRRGRRGNRGGGDDTQTQMGEVTYPFTAFGWTERPKPQTYVLKNATVWTCDDLGVLENTDVLIKDGKIAQIARNINRDDAIQIDATGKHVTPGIIDEHTHIAASRGINEGAQASSAEVRIGDVVDSEDIDIYRQLSGGVTCAQILHGSANPIGGQSAIIKFRWGFSPEEMKYEHAKPFIKFALGENVKRSRSSSNDRFPDSRMGVEQVYVDYFTEAKKYGELKRSGKPFRTDIELECLLEILESKRFITCHSYRQSEINMLMKVAEQFGFRVNTFTHILEGYKVADKMAEHGVGGSSFSDWWAYKFEVYEAIPHNGAIMHEQGVTVAFNSDDAEMARRLNQEAAKAVRFGGVSEEEALKFVTINPAKLLHIDDHTGSLKVGKDADVVLWSDHPLSVYAKAEMTFVDGIKFFDRNEDAKLRQQVADERNRLIQKMLEAKKNGNSTQRPSWRRPRHYHCDTMEDEG
ncbi:MAG: amidohydrolase [Saprospirales bacterium]|nr:amidohydrolase [Saprospirales bacterium]